MRPGAGGGGLERLVFEHRGAFVLGCAVATAVLGATAAARLELEVDLESMLPSGQPIVRAYRQNRGDLRGLGEAIQVVVENRRGTIYDPAYLEALRRIGDELVLMPGVDRAWVRSLWMPGVRFSEVTEDGYRGGPVMPDDYDGSARAMEALRRNVRRAGLAGSLVARDERSSVVFVPLLDRDPSSGRALDPLALSARVGDLRARLEGSGGGVALHVVGLAQLAADLDAGVKQVSVWCAAAALVAAGLILAHTRCARSTILIASCSLVAVVWQAGLVAALGLALDPFSVLVPFLIFALGLSHGAQKMNGVLQDVGRGADPLTAARLTFRRLFGTGLVALLTDAVGFAALAAIDIPVVRRLSLTAGLGVAALVVTNLVLLPVLLSFTGVSPAAAARSARAGVGEGSGGRGWRLLAGLTGRRRAAAVLVVAAVLVAVGLRASLRLEVGDVSRGASELRASSRYNRDVAFVAEHHDLAGDRFAVIVRTASDGCAGYRTLVEADRLAWALRQLPAVRTTTSLPDAVRQITAGTFEGSPKWLTLSPQQDVLDNAVQTAMARNPELVNAECSVTPVVAWLRDHRAESLDEVVRVASDFAARHRGEGREFLLAAGDAGFQAATNLAVRQAGWGMTVGVYAAVVLLCQAAFRSWRAVLVTMVPLAATSVLCAALMASLGIGVKVATLPVIALGVGIPDHALYLLSVQLAHQRAGLPLAEAHRRSLRFTGRAVALVSLTLACGVAAWAFSPIRMQADMGLLLAFMFVGSMVGALVLIPALSPFLLAGIGKEGGGR